MLPDRIHTQIRQARERAGFSQAEMAEELGVGRTTYIAFEVGRTRRFHPLATKMAARLGISEEELLFGHPADDRLLRDKMALDEWKQATVSSYEQQISTLMDKLAAADKLISLLEAQQRTLTESNQYLLSQLRKND